MSNEAISNSIDGSDIGADETFNNTGTAARNAANGIGALANALSADTKVGVRQLKRGVEGKSAEVAGFMRKSIRKRPSLTIGIVGGLGLLTGLVLAGRR